MATERSTATRMPMPEWENTQKQIYLLASLIDGLDIDGFIDVGERADAIAPFVDPTLYIAKHADLDRVLTVARKMRDLQVTLHGLGLHREIAR